VIRDAMRERRACCRRPAGSIGLAALVAALVTGPATASVLDVGPDGRVTVIDGPSVQLSSDPRAARPIEGPTVTRQPTQTTAAPRASGDVGAVIASAANAARLNPSLIEAVAWRESRFRPDARSPKGAFGVMQLTPATARSLGVTPGDVAANVDGGAIYLRRLMARYDGDLVKALAAYNAGPGAVDAYGGTPPFRETRAYVDAVLESLAQRVAPDPRTPETRSRR
jgi:soluble lytic murein transglycosylase-like protein